jgi:hypothetical protein
MAPAGDGRLPRFRRDHIVRASRRQPDYARRHALAWGWVAMLKSLRILAVLLLAGFAGVALPPLANAEIIVVPPGNRNDKRPKIAGLSKLWTSAISKVPYDVKYRQIYTMLKRNPGLIANIKKVAGIYGIDPVHMVGAIVGEHTFNVDGLDSLQGYYVKAEQYINLDMSFAYGGETAAEFFRRPQFDRCNQYNTNYERWDCYSVVWKDKFEGKFVGGKRFKNDRLQRVFFAPGIRGQTFGLAQMSPVTALSVNDVVHATSGLPLLDINKANKVYEVVMDPDKTIHYVAAQIRISIDLYRNIAGFDISQNPGIVATLYNLGESATRARALKAENDRRRAKGQPPVYPEENFYGWLVNDKLDDLRQLLG